MRLKDKVAVITGGARGIGKETALLFAREGGRVVICDVDAQTGQAALEEIKACGAGALFYKVDVTNRAEVAAMVDGAVQKFGRIDILINNAGITQDGFLTKLTEEQWDRVVDINLKGVFNCSQAVAQVMLNQGRGKIINASSVVGVYGNIGQTNYAATKAGVIGMTRSWAKELGKKGINVNAVAPGFIVTDMTSKVPEKVLDLMKEKTPLGRLGQPKDIANAYLFLASDEADYVNGAILSVDGGLVL
ncbi:MAG: 3-oxoacyl-ACP reductase FabG [Firmicutes bacterium]|nr:3-oxoacyl-ACP reductase FabG [Bacillota bacterium]